MSEAWRVYGGDVVYAHRDTEEEARQLVIDDRHLIEKFGYPRVERVVLPFAARRKEADDD